MKKQFSLFLLTSSFTITFMLANSCLKETIAATSTNCDVRGTYSGTSLSSRGTVAKMTYKLQDNNFAIGSVTPTGTVVTFGGYRNTCDSVILSVYFTNNSSYYILRGKLQNGKKAISGTFKNLTTPSDFGTFNISK